MAPVVTPSRRAVTSSPVIAGGRVYLGVNNGEPRDPKHAGDRGVLMCFDERDGKLLWQLVVPKLKSGKVNDWENLGILSSPTIEGDFVYLVTSRCEVMCLDVNGLANGNQGMQDEGKYMSKDTGAPPAKVGPRRAGSAATAYRSSRTPGICTPVMSTMMRSIETRPRIGSFAPPRTP